MNRPSVIVVAVDFSRDSAWAVHVANAWARAFGAKIVLVHAYTAAHPSTPHHAVADDVGELPLLREDGPMEHEYAQNLIQRWADACRRSGIEASAVAREGMPENVILAAADEHNADLIILGREGQGRVRRLILGSVSRYITDHSRRPVLVLPRFATGTTGA